MRLLLLHLALSYCVIRMANILFAFVKCIVILSFGHSGAVVSAITSQQEFPKGACVGSLPLPPTVH